MKNYNILVPYIRARYPILQITTPEENRVGLLVLEAIEQLNSQIKFNPDLWLWSHTAGLRKIEKNAPPKIDMETMDPVEALRKIHDLKKPSIIIMADPHPFMEIPMVRRLLRDIANDFRTAIDMKKEILRRTLIITTPDHTVHSDLQHDITMIDFELPDGKLINDMVNGLFTANKIKITGNDSLPTIHDVVEACKGLTTTEISDALSKSIIIQKLQTNAPTIAQLVMDEKANAIKKSGVLEYYQTDANMANVGGLENLKDWLEIRKSAFTEEAKKFGLPSPRGILLAGVPGCGKSLLAKAAASKFVVPLIRLDIGRVFGGIVGESERNMRHAIRTVEAIGSSILWIDEIDKAFAGMMSSQTGDSGVSQRVFGNFITWMQEKKSPTFIITTANRIEGLPPELMRKGRFDEIFFVDLPNDLEREEILNIHVSRRRPGLKLDLSDCVSDSEGFSGAELEEAVISALYQAFYAKTELNEDMIRDAINKTNPLSKTRSSEIEAMRAWAGTNAVNASKHLTIGYGSRKID